MANFFGYPLIQVAMSLYGNGALASSGALSLGTTAGTGRSISAEFSPNHPSPSAPHSISEYQGSANMEVATRHRQYNGTWSGWNVANDLGNWGNSDSYVTTCAVSNEYAWWEIEFCLSACSTNSVYPRDHGDPTAFSDYYGREYSCYIDTRIIIAAFGSGLQAVCAGAGWSNAHTVGWTVGQNLHNTNSLNYNFFIYKGQNADSWLCTESRWRIGYYNDFVCKCSIHCWC